jgi:EpsI family protein
MMSRLTRTILCGAILSSGLAAQAGLERLNHTVRPALRQPLASVPLEIGDWSGKDEPVEADIVDRAQTTEYLNRTYESRKLPGLKLRLWVNFSLQGTNLRHSPKICLPSGGWTEIESMTRVVRVPLGTGRSIAVTRLGYQRGEVVEHVGFWYYIFGEGSLENYVRQLSITSRSSHGQTTRGSSMTVEVFYLGDHDSEGEALKAFAQELVKTLEPILPAERAAYHVP